MIKRWRSRVRKLGETEDCNTNEENSSILNTEEKTENKKRSQSTGLAKKHKVQELIQVR